VGSKAYVEEVIARKEAGFFFDQVFGSDMVGLNRPGEKGWKLYLLLGFDSPCLDMYLARNFTFLQMVINSLPRLEVKTDEVEIEETNHRRSDGKSFEHVGVPVLRFAGGRKTSLYDAYHTKESVVWETARLLFPILVIPVKTGIQGSSCFSGCPPPRA
jgi:hypothetical protein